VPAFQPEKHQGVVGKVSKGVRMIRVFSYHCVRNEEKNIAKMINHLQNQTLPITKIVIINDGSTDNTSQIARDMKVNVIDLPDENRDRREHGDFAKLPNLALSKMDKEYDFILNCGGDHLLPPDYLEVITSEMTRDKKLGVCAGYIKGEPSKVPRGSGRVTRYEILASIGFKIPVRFGYESYLLYKSNQLGFENKIVDIESTVLRPTQKTYTKGVAKAYGKSYRALGYNPLFVLGNSILRRKSPLNIMYQIIGYMSRVEPYDSEIRGFIAKEQSKVLRNMLRKAIKI
jgi:glycosyltransferase involved in cell wall biosynthesis